jgi:hypothetical protein
MKVPIGSKRPMAPISTNGSWRGKTSMTRSTYSGSTKTSDRKHEECLALIMRHKDERVEVKQYSPTPT